MSEGPKPSEEVIRSVLNYVLSHDGISIWVNVRAYYTHDKIIEGGLHHVGVNGALAFMEDRDAYELGLDKEQSQLLREDPDQFWADWWCVSVTQYRLWKKCVDEDCRCTGITKKGKRCKNEAVDDNGRFWRPIYEGHCAGSYEPPKLTPKDYVPGFSDRCRLHSGK